MICDAMASNCERYLVAAKKPPTLPKAMSIKLKMSFNKKRMVKSSEEMHIADTAKRCPFGQFQGIKCVEVVEAAAGP